MERKEEVTIHDNTIRPQSLEDYIGQETIKNNLKIYMEAAKARTDPLDHVLLYGPPGLGKTTLAGIIVKEMDVEIKISSGPAIEKPCDIVAVLNNLQDGDVVFVDEIHRLNRQVEEVLYPAMEDFAIDIMLNADNGKKSLRLDLPKFTLIGATTRGRPFDGAAAGSVWHYPENGVLPSRRTEEDCRTDSAHAWNGN